MTAKATCQLQPASGEMRNARLRTPSVETMALSFLLACLNASVSRVCKIYHSRWLVKKTPAFTTTEPLYLRKPDESSKTCQAKQQLFFFFLAWGAGVHSMQVASSRQAFLVHSASLSSPLWGSALSGHSQCADLNREWSCCLSIASCPAQWGHLGKR